MKSKLRQITDSLRGLRKVTLTGVCDLVDVAATLTAVVRRFAYRQHIVMVN